LARSRDLDADALVLAADRLEEVQLGLDVVDERRGRLVERRLDERLRREVEDPIGKDSVDELLDGAGVGELAVEERDAALASLVALARAGREAALDNVEHAPQRERFEVLHARAPAVSAEDGDVRVIREDGFGKVASGETRHSGDQP